jgi:regulator of protease activity HflC (stomatin/prohibitin superfamily)
MIRAIARQAEAERERRARIINAEGEMQAAQKLLEASEVLGRSTLGMQLRYLQTLAQIAGEKSSVIAFPMPLDLVKPLLNLGDSLKGGSKSD